MLIEERDEAIQEISQQIGEVHEIFQARRQLLQHCGMGRQYYEFWVQSSVVYSAKTALG